jgi:hypothetical protein
MSVVSIATLMGTNTSAHGSRGKRPGAESATYLVGTRHDGLKTGPRPVVGSGRGFEACGCGEHSAGRGRLRCLQAYINSADRSIDRHRAPRQPRSGHMTAEDIAERLRARKVGKGWAAKCPAHDDDSASLSIGSGADGRVLLKCHAGCDLDTILQKAGLTLSDLFPGGGRGSTSSRKPFEHSNTDHPGRQRLAGNLALADVLDDLATRMEHRDRWPSRERVRWTRED